MMAVASLQLPPVPPLLPARNGCCAAGARPPRVAALSCTCKYNQFTNAQGRTRLRSHVTRRAAALSFLSSAVLASSLVAATPAEARTSRLENKRKVMEKLEKLREKVLGPKEKKGDTGKGMPPANLLMPPPSVEAAL
ncbi:hypothetical protein U9M48_018258 [Paspalum notatum var. saurae]|uniref:Uncharacterized protein n=1 Tax=Paspalum notatum var. saurae TaxID=547442 RepID=A0AAQ3TD34_PASNO